MHTQASTCTHTETHMHSHTHTCIHTHNHTGTFTHSHRHTHTLTHTHMHTHSHVVIHITLISSVLLFPLLTYPGLLSAFCLTLFHSLFHLTHFLCTWDVGWLRHTWECQRTAWRSSYHMSTRGWIYIARHGDRCFYQKVHVVSPFYCSCYFGVHWHT